MERPTVNAAVRTETGKGPNRRLRTSGRFPGVVYGSTTEPLPVTLDPRVMADLLNGPYGRNTVMDLQVEGEDSPRLVIVRDVQLHVLRRDLVHMDLWQISPDKKLSLQVPLRRLGLCEAETTGSVARQARATLNVLCLPDDIPEAIEFDMTTLVGEFPSVNVSELPVPEGVEVVYESDYNIIRVIVPKVLIEEIIEEEDEEEGEAPEEGEDATTKEATTEDA